MSTQHRVPSFRNSVIVCLYKNKGEKPDCFNYRGITLLSIAVKILGNTMTTDMIFELQQLQEKCPEQFIMSLCVAFIDLKKAFHIVRQDSMWKILGMIPHHPPST